MQEISASPEILYVGKRGQSAEPSLGEQFQVSTGWMEDTEAWPAGRSIDCLVVDGTTDGGIETVRQLRRSYPSTPLVAFSRGSAVEQLLDAGATDVVLSCPGEAPRALVRRRVSNACKVDSVSGMAQHGPHTDESLLEQLSENLEDVIWVRNPNNEPGEEVEFVSAGYETIWDRPREHPLVGGTDAVFETIHPDDRDRVREAATDRLTTSTSREVTFRIRRPDGEIRWVQDRALVVPDDGEGTRIVGIARDITERERRRQTLERRDDLFSKAQEIADVGAWEYSLDGPNHWTEKVYDIFGLPEDTTPELDTVREYYHPGDWSDIADKLDRAIQHGEPFDTEARIVRDNSEKRWVRLRGDPQTADGEVVRVRGVVQDITEYRERERDLERNRQFLEQAQAVGDVGGWQYDFRTGTGTVSDDTLKMLGLPTGTEPVLSDIVECCHPEDRKKAQAAIDRLCRDGEPLDMEIRIEPAEGERKWVSSHGEPIIENGEVVGMRGVSIDITDRVEREQRLQAERDLVERILETSPVGIMVSNADLEILSANDEAATVLGVEPGTLEGQQTTPEGLEILSASGDPRSEDEIAVERVRQTGEPVHDEELVVETPDGKRRHIVADVVPLFDDGELHRIVSTLEDVTDWVKLDRINQTIREVDTALVDATTREEVEQAVCEQFAGSKQYSCALMFRADGDGLRAGATGRPAAEFDPETLVSAMPPSAPTRRAADNGEPHTSSRVDADWTVCQDRQSPDVRSVAAIPVTDDGETHGVLTIGSNRPDAFDARELDVLDRFGRTVGHAVAAVESREREETLTSLYEGTQDLLAVDGKQDVCETVVGTAASVLDPPGIGIFLFDDAESTLELAAGTDQLPEFYGDSTTFSPGGADSITWQTYLDGEERFFTDVRNSEHVADPDTAARAGLLVPLDDHGVFVVVASERTSFDEQKRRLIGLLAATTEAALDRVADRTGRRELERRLAEQTDRFERFDEVLGFVCEVASILRSADTREEVEQGICDRLVDLDPYALAWVGAVPADGDTVQPRAWADGTTAGRGEAGYLDDLSFDIDGDAPVAQAVSSGEPVYLADLTDHLQGPDWARAAVERGYRSVFAIPLMHGETVQGVLAVYATAGRALDGTIRETLSHLGRTIPHVVSRLERDHATLPGRSVELKLRFPDPDTFLNTVAETVDSPVEYRDVTPLGNGQTRVLFTLTDPPVETISALETASVTVESLETVERGRDVTFRATLSSATVPATLLSCGAIPREVCAQPAGTTATVRLTQSSDVRAFLDRVQNRYDVELASRRDIDGRADTTATEHALARDLTDRQREVLRTAYESGFFESPRETTGVELADRLGISQPTVTHHLREAQRRLFDTLFQPTR